MICKTVRTCQGRGRGREPVTGRGRRAPPTLIFMVLGARAVISFCMRSAMPGYIIGAPRHDVVGVQVLPDVDVALHDAVVGGLVDAHDSMPGGRGGERETGAGSPGARGAGTGRMAAARGSPMNEGWKERLRAAEALVADGDDLTVEAARSSSPGRRRRRRWPFRSQSPRPRSTASP